MIYLSGERLECWTDCILVFGKVHASNEGLSWYFWDKAPVIFENVFSRLAFYQRQMFVGLQAPRVTSHATVEGHKPPGELGAQPTQQLHQE